MDGLSITLLTLWTLTLPITGTLAFLTIRLRSDRDDAAENVSEWYDYATQWYRYARKLERTVHSVNRGRTSVTRLDEYRQTLREEHGLTAKEPQL